MRKKIRIGTRGSLLAKAQTGIVQSLLGKSCPNVETEIVVISTRGDKIQTDDSHLPDTKAAFTEDIETLLVNGDIDIAVHSMKDLPAVLKPGLILGATPPRGDPRDVLVCHNSYSFADLRTEARIGTSSLRRKVQLTRLRNDVKVLEMRGNVETRIRKMTEFKFDAIVLSASVFERIKIQDVVVTPFSVEQMVPAAGQGIIAVEIRKDDRDAFELVSTINDEKTWTEAECERAFLERLGGDCHTPVAAHCQSVDDMLIAMGLIASQDGTRLLKTKLQRYTDARALGIRLADELLAMGGKEIMEVQKV